MVRRRLICVVGQISDLAVQPPLQKYFLFSSDPNHRLILFCPVPGRGALAIVTNVGRGMRWTRQRRRAFWRGRAMLTRTAKPCGPDAPMLASSSWEASFIRDDGDNRPVTGESAEETVKTIAQGRPGVPANLWSTTVCFLPFAHGAAGAMGTRLSLRPL